MKLMDILLEDENKEKLIKKAKTIYKGVKTGVLRKGVFGKVVYVLPDEYDIQIDVHDDIFIKFGNNRTKKGVKFYYVNDDDGEMKPLRVNPTEYQMNLRLIEKKKFTPFDIVIWWEESYQTNDPEVMNENEEDNKLKKKVKVVFKALNKKMCRKRDNYKFYFVLPDHYNVLETDTPEIKEYRSSRRESDVLYVQVGRDGENSGVKFFDKVEGDDKLNKMSFDKLEQYGANLFFVNEKFKPFNIKLIYKNYSGKWD